MEPGMSAVYSRLRLKCSGVRGGLLSACKWIFCARRFCEDCLLAALTVSALPAVIDEPGAGAPSPTPAEKERGENCCSIISPDLTRLIMPPRIPRLRKKPPRLHKRDLTIAVWLIKVWRRIRRWHPPASADASAGHYRTRGRRRSGSDWGRFLRS